MAIVVRTAIESGDQAAHDRLDQLVEAAIGRQGGPPDGLMVHLACPSGQGFLIIDVWRSENAFRAWWSDVMEPALAEVDLTTGGQEITSVWSLARP